MPNKILTATELAEYLRVHRSTISRLARERKIPAFRVGSDWRFILEQIDEWKAAQEKRFQAGTPPAKPDEKRVVSNSTSGSAATSRSRPGRSAPSK